MNLPQSPLLSQGCNRLREARVSGPDCGPHIVSHESCGWLEDVKRGLEAWLHFPFLLHVALRAPTIRAL